MEGKEHSLGIQAANRENPRARNSSLFLNVAPSSPWLKATHNWGLNWRASRGCWVWSHLISSSKVHFIPYFHTDRVNLNNSCIEAGFWMTCLADRNVTFSKHNVFKSSETSFCWSQNHLRNSVKCSSLKCWSQKDDCLPVFPPRSSSLCLYWDVSAWPSLSPVKICLLFNSLIPWFQSLTWFSLSS